MKITLCVMTLNEIDSMKVIMPTVDTSIFDQVLVIDGGSTDGTIEWSKEHGYEVYVQKERGLRQAYLEALPHIRGDVMITFSPDGNSVASLLPDLVNELKNIPGRVNRNPMFHRTTSVENSNFLFAHVFSLIVISRSLLPVLN